MTENNKKKVLVSLVSAVLGLVFPWMEELYRWTGSNTDCSTDQRSFAKVHWPVIDGQVPHTTHIRLPGGGILWQEVICGSMNKRRIWKLEACYQHGEKKVL